MKAKLKPPENSSVPYWGSSQSLLREGNPAAPPLSKPHRIKSVHAVYANSYWPSGSARVCVPHTTFISLANIDRKLGSFFSSTAQYTNLHKNNALTVKTSYTIKNHHQIYFTILNKYSF